MAWAFRRDHEDINIRRRHDLAEMDVEAVPERNGIARLRVRLDTLCVERGLILVVDEDHDDIRLLAGLSDGEHGVPVADGRIPGLAASQANHDIEAGLLEVERMRVPL